MNHVLECWNRPDLLPNTAPRETCVLVRFIPKALTFPYNPTTYSLGKKKASNAKPSWTLPSPNGASLANDSKVDITQSSSKFWFMAKGLHDATRDVGLYPN